MAFFARHTGTLTGTTAFTAGEPKWRLELADLPGTPLGDITDAKNREITFQLVKPSTVEFTLPTSHPRFADLMSNQHMHVNVYRENELVLVAETTALQLVGRSGERGVRCVATEAGWVRLQKRLIGKSTAGVTFTDSDRAYMALLILLIVDAEADSRVGAGTLMPSGSMATAGPWYYKRAMEAITELGAPLNGFDWWFTPVNPEGGGDVALLNTAAVRGAYRPEAIFEYGTGQFNAREYEWRITTGDRISRAYSLPPSYPNNAGLVVASSFDATTELNIGRREDLVESDLGDAGGTLRQALTDETVEVRKNPKNVFLIQPSVDDGGGRVPTFRTDYDIGDIVEGRVLDEDALLLDGLVRIYGVQIQLDDLGNEEITLGLVDEDL